MCLLLCINYYKSTLILLLIASALTGVEMSDAALLPLWEYFMSGYYLFLNNAEISICYRSYIKRILGECLLKALRTLVDIARLAERFIIPSQSLAW